MPKKVLYKEELCGKILNGMNTLADSIKKTMGPLGRNVSVEAEGRVLIISDGSLIVKEINLKDAAQNIGVQLIRDMAEKTENICGRGLVTSVVLMQCLVNEGMHQIASGAEPVEIRKGIQSAAFLAGKAIQKLAKPVENHEQLFQVAEIASGDKESGKMIVSACLDTGETGTVTVDEGNELETELELHRGMTFERGYLREEMVTDRVSEISVLKHPYILITDKEITSAEQIAEILDMTAQTGRPLLIIAEKVTGTAMGALILNHQKGILKCAAVNPPAYGEGRRARMEDLAVYTGGVYFTEELGYRLDSCTLDMLGNAEEVRIDRHSTSVIGGMGDPVQIAQRIHQLQLLHSKNTHEFDKKALEERIAKLSGGAAILHIGGASPAEIREKTVQARQALRAVRAAQKYGVCDGGGTVFLEILPAVKAYANSLEGDKKTGALILCRALLQPAMQLAENAGYDGKVMISKVKEQPRGYGFDVRSGNFVNMKNQGILDPAQSAGMALAGAASAASMLLVTEAGIIDLKK